MSHNATFFTYSNLGAEDLPDGFEYPTMEELSEQVRDHS